MGMFDYVNFEMECPNCKKLVNKFQTKDLDCALEVVEIDNLNNFYTICDNCNFWIEFKKEIPVKEKKELKEKATLEDAYRLNFKLETQKLEN